MLLLGTGSGWGSQPPAQARRRLVQPAQPSAAQRSASSSRAAAPTRCPPRGGGCGTALRSGTRYCGAQAAAAAPAAQSWPWRGAASTPPLAAGGDRWWGRAGTRLGVWMQRSGSPAARRSRRQPAAASAKHARLASSSMHAVIWRKHQLLKAAHLASCTSRSSFPHPRPCPAPLRHAHRVWHLGQRGAARQYVAQPLLHRTKLDVVALEAGSIGRHSNLDGLAHPAHTQHARTRAQQALEAVGRSWRHCLPQQAGHRGGAQAAPACTQARPAPESGRQRLAGRWASPPCPGCPASPQSPSTPPTPASGTRRPRAWHAPAPGKPPAHAMPDRPRRRRSWAAAAPAPRCSTLLCRPLTDVRAPPPQGPRAAHQAGCQEHSSHHGELH